MLGARFTFHRREHRAGLHEGRYEWLWQAAAAAQVPLMVFVPGSVPAIDAIAERHPGLRLVIDHLALAVGGPSDAAFAHLPALLRLARLPNVAVKASALPNYSREPYPFRDLHAHVRAVVDAFGPRRVFFGTDWTRLACRYDEPKNGSYPLVLRVDSA
jgi:predicted TIM-barrel fold metal-dependent hydrolase